MSLRCVSGSTRPCGCSRSCSPDLLRRRRRRRRERNVPEVTELVDLLRKGLEEVLLAFGEYATSLGLEARELREAREAIGRKDMVERRV